MYFIMFMAQSEDDYLKLKAIDNQDELMEYLDNKKISYAVYNNVPLDVIFGQGIVDAGKAINGLGAINVRRLDKSDISSDYTVAGVNGKTKQALYTVDTQGYNSTWSNSIGEIRAGYIAENPLTGKSSVDDTDNSGYDENSNDFNEKFAGLTDLHDRWVFYTTNNLMITLLIVKIITGWLIIIYSSTTNKLQLPGLPDCTQACIKPARAF